MNPNDWSSGCGSGSRSKPEPAEAVEPVGPVEAGNHHSPTCSMAWKYKGKTLSPSLTPLNPPHPPSPQISPNHIRPPMQPQPSTQDLIIRLRTLLDSVISILRSTSPNPRIHSLHAFYDRIVDLLSSVSSSSSSSFSSSLSSPDVIMTLDSEMVEKLESEWWNSEIVAAWFGPTRALRERGLGRAGEPAGAMNVKADMVYVGLHDE